MNIKNVYRFFGKDYHRRQLLKNTSSSVMREYLDKPFPGKKSLISELDIVSLDIETTGLDPNKDKIVSIGLVNIERLGINLESCWHEIIKVKKSLNEDSVVIHKITDDQTAVGMALDNVIPKLLERLQGKILLAHNAKVEMGFINKACQNLYNTEFVIPVIDTQLLSIRSLDRTNQVYKSNELRLFNLRRTYNLPTYKAHNALMDAIATAELFLVMANKISPGKTAKLSEFLS